MVLTLIALNAFLYSTKHWYHICKNILIMTTLYILEAKEGYLASRRPWWWREVDAELFRVPSALCCPTSVSWGTASISEGKGDRSVFILSLSREQRQQHLSMGKVGLIPLLNFIITNSSPGIKSNSRNTTSPHTLRQESFIGESTSEILFHHELMVFWVFGFSHFFIIAKIWTSNTKAVL